jgi:arylsulfatase A-like enzyme
MSTQPNILLLFTDQQRFDTIAAAGHSHMKTPNLDRLVREGCLFTNAYSPNPVCVPARHCLITGHHGRQHGFFSNGGKFMKRDLPTLPQVLAENGYFTAAVGKMHFLPTLNYNGFNEMHLMEEIPANRGEDAYATYLAEQGLQDVRALHGVRPLIYHEPQRAVMPPEHHGEAWVARQTIDVLERNQEQPFFVMCGFIKPHPPWNLPKGWEDHYGDVDLPDPIACGRVKPGFVDGSPWFGDHDTPEQRRAIRAAYYASISWVDHNIGVLLDYLEKRGLLDDMMIIFTSDHGEMLQDHGLYQKECPWESASRIPMVIRQPGIFTAGSRDDRLVDLLDILPTALDFAGADYYEKPCRKELPLPGASLLPAHRPDWNRTTQYVGSGHHPWRWVFVRDERYKYVFYYTGGFEYLYDLQTDPQEQHDLIAAGNAPAGVVERLRTRLIACETEHGPEGAVVNGQFVTRAWTPPATARGMGKFPNWANMQVPALGRETPEREGELLVNDTLMAVGNPSPAFFRERAPEQWWLDHWSEQFAARGGTPEQRARLLDGKPCP